MISVFGTVFVDIKGYSKVPFNPAGRNIGVVRTTYGGVGHNVARILNYLGLDIEFISTIEPSGTGRDIVKKLVDDGVGTSYLQYAEQGMGIWHVIFDQDGELAGSISQQPDFTGLQEVIDAKGDEIVQASDAIILEVDLNADIARKVCKLAQKYKKPIYALVSNLSVVRECPELLPIFDCFICNNIEARDLLNDYVVDDKELCERLASKYELRKCIVTFGEKGSLYYDAVHSKSGMQDIYKVQVIDTAGAGDAFFSGAAYGLIKGNDIAASAKIGAKVSSMVVSCEECVTKEIMNIHRTIY